MDNVVSLLTKLVAFESISHKPMRDIAAFVASFCENLGFKVSIYECPTDKTKANVVCSAGPEKAGGLVISGHLDVVPTSGQPWESDPFKLRESNGLLFGRGTADMKGFIASTLIAIQNIDLKKLQKPLMLIWTHDEEVGCQGSRNLMETFQKSSIFFPNEVLIGEPTDFQILRMHSGHVSLTITTHGKAAHSSKPHLGANAIKAMHAVQGMLFELEQELKENVSLKEFYDNPIITTNIGKVSGGTAVNIIPSSCEVEFGYRPLPGDDAGEFTRKIQHRLEQLILPPGTSVSLKKGLHLPAMCTPAGGLLESQLLPFAAQNSVGAASFGTDGGNFRQSGMAPLIFGPGSIDVAHKANEFVKLSDLEHSLMLTSSLIQKRLMG